MSGQILNIVFKNNVNRLIAINRIQKKKIVVYRIDECVLCIFIMYIYKYKHMHVYISKNICCIIVI